MTRGSGLEDVEGALRAKRDLPRAIVGEFGVGFDAVECSREVVVHGFLVFVLGLDLSRCKLGCQDVQ